MKKLMLSIFALAVFGFSVSAQTSATVEGVTVDATLVKPIKLTNDAGLNFGKIAIGDVDGTITVAASADPTFTRSDVNAALVASSAVQTAAHFGVTGNGLYTYKVTLPSDDVSLAAGISVGTFTTNLENNIGAIGTNDEFYVGAILSYEAAYVTGDNLNGTFDVTVAYE